MDLLLALSEDAVHEVLWTDALLDEWENVIVREHKRAAETATSVTAAIREFFADSKIERGTYEYLVQEMPGEDADDHEHMAAAITGGASVLLTHDKRGFPTRPLAARGLRVTDPDTYLCELADAFTREAADTVTRLAAEKKNPSRTSADLLTDLERAGVPRFAKKVKTYHSSGPEAGLSRVP